MFGFNESLTQQKFTNKSNSTLNGSILFLNQSQKANIFATIFIIIVGLVGNILTIFVFSQKRFRTNTSNVYLLCLAINDCFFLIVHFFQDTVHTLDQVYFFLDYPSLNRFFQLLNLVDRFDAACRVLNYFRYVLCFISVYIILAYTIQRLLIVKSPIINRSKSKNSAYRIISLIILISLVINGWSLYLFELNQNKCDVKLDWLQIYYKINVSFLILIMCIPILVIIICNFIIIIKTLNAEAKRKCLQIKSSPSNKELSGLRKNSSQLDNSLFSFHDSITRDEIKKINDFKSSYKRTVSEEYDTLTRMKMPTSGKERVMLSDPFFNSISLNSFKIKPYYVSVNQATIRGSGKSIDSKKVTKTLVLISFLYTLFNLSYFICFCIYYYDFFVAKIDPVHMNYLLGAFELSEIFYILNYGMIFYIYCASGSIFRNQLRYSRHFKSKNKPNFVKIQYYMEVF